MHLVIDARGSVRAVYGEEIDLATLGRPAIARASHVEPDPRRPLDGRPPAGRSGRCSARSAIAARPWRPSGRGWKRTGSRRRPEPSGREPGGPLERQ